MNISLGVPDRELGATPNSRRTLGGGPGLSGESLEHHGRLDSIAATETLAARR